MLFTLQRYEFFSKSQRNCVGIFLQYDVVYPTKVRIFQQITTQYKNREDYVRCCLPYKGTNFSANHNTRFIKPRNRNDVVYPTKVRIFQQITTVVSTIILIVWMLFTLQRYEFFSKSQPAYRDSPRRWDVVYPTKVRIFQQITTSTNVSDCTFRMLFTLQRYEFFSKSQRAL